MSDHSYQVGQNVRVKGSYRLRDLGGSYKILALLPEEHGDFQYRVRSSTSAQQRVIRESEIDAAHSPEMTFSA
jgi:hypothetical protein